MKWSWEKQFKACVAVGLIAIGAQLVSPLPWTVRVVCAAVPVIVGIIISSQRTWWRRRVSAKLPIFLMLHSVADDVVDASCANNTLRPAELERLIIDLKAAGYVFQTATEAAEAPLPRSVALTFDDGYLDNYTELFPILQRQQVKATCFITNRGAEDPAFLSPTQIRQMQASGLIEFGGHTAAHTVLDTLPPEAVEHAIRANVNWLTEVTGQAPVSFAYPCGGYNDFVVEQVKAAGYRYAFTMHKKMRPVVADPLRIHRQIIPRGKTPLQNYLLATRGKYRL